MTDSRSIPVPGIDSERDIERHAPSPGSVPTTEPLPCPFCGAEQDETLVIDANEGIAYTPQYRVECINLDCVATVGDGSFDTIEEAIAVWNRRRSPQRETPRTATIRVAVAAQAFCAELQEDAEGVPQRELKELHAALDAWEAPGGGSGAGTTDAATEWDALMSRVYTRCGATRPGTTAELVWLAARDAMRSAIAYDQHLSATPLPDPSGATAEEKL